MSRILFVTIFKGYLSFLCGNSCDFDFLAFLAFFAFFVWFRCPLSLASSQQPLGFRRQMRVLFDTLSMMPVCLFLAPLKDRVKLLSRYVLALPVKWISMSFGTPEEKVL